MIRKGYSAWAMSTVAIVGGANVLSASDPIDHAWQFVQSIPVEHSQGQPYVRPMRSQPFVLDIDVLRSALAAAPLEDTPEARSNPLIMSFPTPTGGLEAFAVVESPIMEPGLAAQFPEIKTYLGQGLDQPAATVRFDVNDLGFHAQILSPDGNYWIDPWTMGDTVAYSSYFKNDLEDHHHFRCFTEGTFENATDASPSRLNRGPGTDSTGPVRKTYRTCVAATGEYTAFFGGTVALGQAAIVTAVNRVTGVYEIEFAIRMTLIANNSAVVYTNASTDPYSNNNGSAMLTQNINTLSSVIGNANFDVGHVFSTGGGGVSYLGVICGSNKAGSVTGSPSPTGDAFWIDYVAHEMGHEFGGNHCFNGTAGSCGGGNRSGGSAYEPGSASTIMGYAGICSGDDLQAHSDPYFVHKNYDEIIAYTSAGGNCATTTNTGNTAPTVNGGPDYTIPKSTPFVLTASGNDADGDTLTYCWEQRDLGVAQSAVGGIFADNGDSPFIRSFNPTTDPQRTIPRLSNLLANTFVKGEQLPTLTNPIHFRVTVRDNKAGTGGVNTDDVNINVDTSAGPFVVTSPNTAVNWSGTQTVTWNVANTNAGSVNCANVKISLSTDGGNTYPTVLLASTPNNGSASVALPNINSTTARIKVEAVGNIFFDISNVNFTITTGCATPIVTGQPSAQNVCAGQPASFTITATGQAPLSYQWRKNTVNIGGATNATYSILSVSPGDVGNYDCVVTNTCGNATSNSAALSIGTTPVFTQQPANQTVNVGDSATFTTAVQGQFFNFTYQWRRNGSNLSDNAIISGSNAPSMTIDPVALPDAGTFDCIVAPISGGCPATSDPATLTVNSAPCYGDLNGDNNVGLPDLSILLSHYGLTPATYLDGDLDANNVVDLSDLSIMLSLYGTVCP